MPSSSSIPPKVSRSVTLDIEVAEAVAAAARSQNRSFSNYVETVLFAALSGPMPAAPEGRGSEEGQGDAAADAADAC